ncbi:MAG: transposase, partial [Rhizobiales bacterium]|nr:transposase [Rhizobacter sp.]
MREHPGDERLPFAAFSRPAFAQDAVVALPDGDVRVHFKRPTRAGQTFTTMSRQSFLARLCALVPPPGFHMVRHYRVLAARLLVMRCGPRSSRSPSSSRPPSSSRCSCPVARTSSSMPSPRPQRSPSSPASACRAASPGHACWQRCSPSMS